MHTLTSVRGACAVGVHTNELGMRKSCDSCRRQKKKCEGSRPCRRCLGAGERCTYSKRRWHQVSPWSKHRCQPNGTADLRPPDTSQHSTLGAVLKHGMLPFKRFRLSASPATGLAGMQENGFLSDFFGCIGFLPLATQSHIREALVKMLARPAVGQPPQEPYEREDSIDAVTLEDSLNPTLRGQQLPRDLSTCVFWCAVGLGALVKGNPIESVASYAQLAREALETYSGPATAGVARAWTILSYFYLFRGDLDMYQEYMARSESYLSTSLEQGSAGMLPVGFAEIVQHRIAVKICRGDIDKVVSFCSVEQATPQLREAATEPDLYTFVMRSYKMVQQAVYGAAYNARAAAGGHMGDVDADHEGEDIDPRLFGASAEVLDMMIARLKECSYQFGRLEEAVERPSIRTGIGGLLINGNLFFEKAAKGDFYGTLERIGRCVEVFEKFPGLCRFEMGAHAAHITITALSAMDGPRARELYDTLRNAYNLTRLPGAVPLPRLEEWKGVSQCCQSCYCRAMERLILSDEMTGFSTRADLRGVSQEELRTNGASGKIYEGDGQTRGLLSTGIATEETFALDPHSSNVLCGFNLPNACKANSGPALFLHGEYRRCPTRTLAPTFPLTPKDEMQAIPNADLADGDLSHDGRTGAGVVILAPEVSLTLPEFSESTGATDGTTNKDGLVVEDWLEAVEALFDTAADP